MKGDRSSRGRRGRAPRTTGALLEAVPDGGAIYRQGVEAGMGWASGTGHTDLCDYSAIKSEDVKVTFLHPSTPSEPVELEVAFTGAFQPPSYYVDCVPPGAIGATEAETALFWMAWLDGVHEVEARVAIAPLLAAARWRPKLVMDTPRHDECPICWIQRNLGVEVEIQGYGEGGSPVS